MSELKILPTKQKVVPAYANLSRVREEAARDPERFIKTYWSRYSDPEKGVWIYYPADYAMKDEDGYLWLLGRADEVLKVAGHRIGTMELESALVFPPSVAEAAVVEKPDPVKGERPVAFVVFRKGYSPSTELAKEISNYIRKTIGPIAVPAAVLFLEKLPQDQERQDNEEGT